MSLCISKFHSLISPLISSEKSLSIGKLSSSLGLMWVFQNSYFHWKAPILSLVTIVSIVFLEVTVLLHSFLRKYLPNTRVWITIVCQFFLSNGNGIPWKSTVRSAPDWHSHTSLYLETAVALSPQWKCFLYSFPIIIQNIKNMCSLGSRFNKTKNFYCLIKDVMWTGIFFFLTKNGGEENKDSSYDLVPLTWFLLRH